MAHSTVTDNYGLPLFASGNKPTWNDEWNHTMRSIDSTLKSLNTVNQSQDGDIESLKSRVTTTEEDITKLSEYNINDYRTVGQSGSDGRRNFKFIKTMYNPISISKSKLNGTMKFRMSSRTMSSMTKKEFYTETLGKQNALVLIDQTDFLTFGTSNLIAKPNFNNLFAKSHVRGRIGIPVGTASGDVKYAHINNSDYLIPFRNSFNSSSDFKPYFTEYENGYGLKAIPICYGSDIIIEDSDTVIPENFFNGGVIANNAIIDLDVTVSVYQAIS